MNEAERIASSGAPRASITKLLLAVVYGGALITGTLLGRRGALNPDQVPLTSAADVGLALIGGFSGSPSDADWRRLEADLEEVSAAWSSETRTAFELVTAVRGLSNRLVPEWERAQERCTELKWHCDRSALEALRGGQP